jgi:hypothetical protein
MRNPFVFHIITAYGYKYGLYSGYKNKPNIGFIYKYLHLYSSVFMSAHKKFRILEVFGFRNFG